MKGEEAVDSGFAEASPGNVGSGTDESTINGIVTPASSMNNEYAGLDDWLANDGFDLANVLTDEEYNKLIGLDSEQYGHT